MFDSAFALKMWIFFGTGGAMAVYLFARPLLSTRAWDFYIPGASAEDDYIRQSDDNLRAIQSISWATIANRVTTYSSIALGIILVASIFLLAADPGDLDRSERTLFKVVLVLAAVAVLVYLASVQLWQEVLGRGMSVEKMLEMRKWASFTRAVGQFLLVGSLVLSILTVDTLLGSVVALVAAASVIAYFEYRYYLLTH